MLKTRAAVCEYREHMKTVSSTETERLPVPALRGIYSLFFTCLLAPPVLLFSSIAFSIRSLPVYYSVKTKIMLPPIFYPHYKHVTLIYRIASRTLKLRALGAEQILYR